MDDYPWLLSLFTSSVAATSQWTIAQFLSRNFQPEYSSLILDACENSPILSTEFRSLREPLLLDSEQAVRLRERHREELEWANRRHDTLKPLTSPPKERVLERLKVIEAGNPDAWVDLLLEMTLTDQSRRYDFPPPVVTDMPGWRDSDQTVRLRIIDAAARYLEQGTPEFDALLDTTSYTASAIAAFPAFILLRSQAPQRLASLPLSIWQNWGPVLVDAKAEDEDSIREDRRWLQEQAWRHAPATMLDALRRSIERDAREHKQVFCLNRLYVPWTDTIFDLIRERWRNHQKNPSIARSLLEPLLARKDETSWTECERILSERPLPMGKVSKRRLIHTAELALKHDAGRAWELFLGVVDDDPDTADELIADVACNRSHDFAWVEALQEEAIADFYLLLRRRYPPDGDPPPRTGVFDYLDLREEVSHLRNALITHLASRGSTAAVAAMERLVAIHQGDKWLRWQLTDCRQNTLRSSWKPPGPKEVIALARNRELALIRSGEELLDALQDSLSRLEERLHGSHPVVQFLWNDATGSAKPKEEDALSDFVADHIEGDLHKRGLVAHREVQVRRRGKGIGERSDILVSAITPGDPEGHRALEVVIETKGCWHRELDNAMETQLKAHYLTGERRRYGLYLVGWYLCEKWLETDARKKKCGKMRLPEVRSRLSSQAESLSDEKFRIRSYVLDMRLP
ncbi:hypothetical protein JCM17961_49360 [Endothiovibrio diazotrophicus]